jgi:hypothetical protein
VRPVSDDFLLNMAEVTATLIGLFLVGVFFFVESGLRREEDRMISRSYLRSGTRITLIALTIPLGLSLALVALEPAWGRALFVVLSVVLIAANVDSARQVRGTRSLVLIANEAVATALTVLLLVLPWALGGLEPTREDLTWSILLAFAAGVMSIAAIVMSAFDVTQPSTDENVTTTGAAPEVEVDETTTADPGALEEGRGRDLEAE